MAKIIDIITMGQIEKNFKKSNPSSLRRLINKLLSSFSIFSKLSAACVEPLKPNGIVLGQEEHCSLVGEPLYVVEINFVK